MQPIQRRDLLRDAIPGAAVAFLGIALWFVARTHAPQPQAFVGWLFTLFVISTVATVACRAAGPASPRRVFFTIFFLLLAPCLLVAAIGVGGGYIQPLQFLAVSVVLCTWNTLWALVVRIAHRAGPAGSVAIALLPAMLLMASPIALMPLVHATHGSAIVVQFIRHACPFFALLDAARPSINFDWSHLPGMYAWSGLGSDIPMLLPNAWSCAGIYGGASALIAMIARIVRTGNTTSRTT